MEILLVLDMPMKALSLAVQTWLTELSFQLLVPSPLTSSVTMLTDERSLLNTTISDVKILSVDIAFNLKGSCNLLASNTSLRDTYMLLDRLKYPVLKIEVVIDDVILVSSLAKESD